MWQWYIHRPVRSSGWKHRHALLGDDVPGILPRGEDGRRAGADSIGHADGVVSASTARDAGDRAAVFAPVAAAPVSHVLTLLGGRTLVPREKAPLPRLRPP